ncbi:hypothetical protein [Mesorhizobium sp. M0085]|uniref:hypothetical protein n=1 Tax=Mesorhizobium sp. M0085 TaxID=2956872 RepID=UPI00333CD826
MAGHDRVLACVEHVNKGNRGFSPEFVRLAPVAQWDDGWVPVLDAREAFPGEGLIYWPRPKGHRFEVGQAWIVEVEIRGSGADHYWVRPGPRVTRPWEAVVVPGADDIVALRRALASDCFPLSPSPAGLALVGLPTQDALWLAPFNAIRNPRGHEYGFGTGWSRLLQIDPNGFFDIQLGGIDRRLLDPTSHSADPAGTFVIQSDEQLVAGAARRLKRWDKDAFAALGTTQAVVEAHATLLARVVDQDTADQDSARDEALVALLATDTLAAHTAQGLAETIALHPVVAADIEARVVVGISERRAELDAEFEIRRRELEAGSSAILAAEEARLATLGQERNLLEEAIATLEAELRSAVDRQIAGGIPGLADSLVARMLFHPDSTVPRVVRGVGAKSPDASEKAVTPLTSTKALRAAVMARAAYDRVDGLLAVVAAGLLLGRRTLMLDGSTAAALGGSVAKTLVGPTVLNVAMSPTVFAMGDLLALPVTMAGQAMPLGAALTHAAERDEPVALVLHGANRAPLEGAFGDLLDVIDLQGGPLMAWRDSAGHDAVARLDGRLLIIATLARGPTAFAIPHGLAARIPLLDADRMLYTDDERVAEAPKTTRITSALFDDLAASAAPADQTERWRTLLPSADRTAVLARYLAITAEILPASLGITETFAALSLGRGEFDPAGVAALGGAWPEGFDAAYHHRRLAALFDKGHGC